MISRVYVNGKVAVSPKGGQGSKPGLSVASVLTSRRLIKSIECINK